MLKRRLPRQRHNALARWLLSMVGVTVLFVLCMTSLWYLYGAGTFNRPAADEASQLASLEVSQLIGTSNYTPVPQHRHHWFGAAVHALGVPFQNPAAMIQDQLPPTQSTPWTANMSQSSMFTPLTTFASSTKKIALGWIPDHAPQSLIQTWKNNPGITVLSPSWLTLTTAHGAISDHTATSVISYAHTKHLFVWPMLTNQFDATLTHTLLSSSANQKTLIQTLATHAKSEHWDGLNVDFENVRTADRDAFTTFIQHLHDALQPLHVTLSVDISPDVAFLRDNAAFFHAGLSAACDYLVDMAYDEYWYGEQTAGPVADMPWVQTSVEDLLDTGVPANQIILGMPFYASLWHVHPDGSLTSVLVATSSVPDILSRHSAEATWKPTLQLNFARWGSSNDYEEIWFDTPQTIHDKLRLVADDNLAGVAVWSLSLTSKETWSPMADALRKTVS